MNKHIAVEPFAVRRQRRRVNYAAMFLPLLCAVLAGCLLYTCNEYRRSADRAVERWAKTVGVE